MTDARAFFAPLLSQDIIREEELNPLVNKCNGDRLAVLQQIARAKPSRKELLGRLWGDSIGFSYVDMDKTLFQPQAVEKLPENMARKLKIIPIYQIGDVVTIAAASPEDAGTIRMVGDLIRAQVSPVFSFAEDILDAIEIQYKSKDQITALLARIAASPVYQAAGTVTEEQLRNVAGSEYMVEFTNHVLLLGVKERASDIHIDPQEDKIYVRFRVDGVLHDRLMVEKALLSPLISRLKIMANLDINEKRKPQDGRITLALAARSIDYRVSVLPTIYGEKIVIRVLGSASKSEIPDLPELNFSRTHLSDLKKLIGRPNGILFITGPTGSGKSTTLFSILKALNEPGVNIMTAEDPVEYRLPRLNQVHINPAVGMDFSAALRAFLRQDPDVILIGEIRDVETAQITVRVALTGHLVLASLHTNNALQAITRLIDMGVEPFLVAPAIVGALAQRLVRRICQSCKEPYTPSPEEIDKYFVWDKQTRVVYYRGAGCQDCNQTGYAGRLALHELIAVDGEVRGMIARNASLMEIEDRLAENGFRPMLHDGLKKVLMGQTTISEIERVVAEES